MKPQDKAGKLSVAFVFDRYHPDGRGEGYFSWLIEELSKRGHDVHVFAAMAKRETAKKYQLHRVPVFKYPRSLMLVSFLINSARALRREKFEIIHGVGRCLDINVFNPHGGVEKAYLKQEFCSISNGLYLLYKSVIRYVSLQHYLKIWIQKKQYLRTEVRKFIAISKMVKKDMMQYYGVPEEKISVLTNCIDLERFHPRNRAVYRASKRKELGIDEKTVILLFAGNNYRLKGLGPLLAALTLLRRRFPNQHIRLLVAGRGKVGRYSRRAAKLGILGCTTFLGPVQGMERYYAASDIYVQPTFYDPCSLTVLEALASGLPVITTRFNGAADVMTSDRGGRVIEDPANVEDLAESIALFLKEERRNEARVVSRQWMESYSPARHIEEILRIYHEAAGHT